MYCIVTIGTLSWWSLIVIQSLSGCLEWQKPPTIYDITLKHCSSGCLREETANITANKPTKPPTKWCLRLYFAGLEYISPQCKCCQPLCYQDTYQQANHSNQLCWLELSHVQVSAYLSLTDHPVKNSWVIAEDVSQGDIFEVSYKLPLFVENYTLNMINNELLSVSKQQ